jgi:hypothetical protein
MSSDLALMEKHDRCDVLGIAQRQQRCGRLTLQRGEVKLADTITLQHEVDEAIAKATNAIKENQRMFSGLRHQTSQHLYRPLTI